MAAVPTLRPSDPTIFASGRTAPAYETEFFATGNLAALPDQLLVTGLKWIWTSWRPYDRAVEYANPALPAERQFTLLAANYRRLAQVTGAGLTTPLNQ